MTLVITSCTNRKRKPIPRALHISDLPAASLSDVAASWGQRLSAVSDRFPASEVYGGRSFQEAACAAGKLDARLLVISAGLGLIDASSPIPPYACTVLIGADDSVADRITGQFSISEWWGALKGASPFARSLVSFVDDEEAGPILAALSDAYLAMIANELAAVRRRNIWHNSRRKLTECGPRLGVNIRRRACGAASADVRWSVA